MRFSISESSSPRAKSSSRQCTRNRSSRTSTVMVPGVMVMELPRITLPEPVLSRVWKEVTSGCTTRRGDQMRRMVAMPDLNTSPTR